jgi:predicted TIM-barrel fold metal-dependent hydrolase
MAYQGPLCFDNSSQAAAEPVFEDVLQGRVVDRAPLTGYLFHRFVQRARELGLPVQVHTGYLAGNWGSPAQGDPTPLIPVLQRYRDVRFDLFHAGWPYHDLMACIGKAFPNVYLDLCWAWSMNPAAMERALEDWLAAVPHNRILGYGGDTGMPFAMVGYAAQARDGIARVLERKVDRGDYDLATAQQAARRILHENARELYGL